MIVRSFPSPASPAEHRLIHQERFRQDPLLKKDAAENTPQTTEQPREIAKKMESSPALSAMAMQHSFEKALHTHAIEVAASQKAAKNLEMQAEQQNKNTDMTVQAMMGPAGLFSEAQTKTEHGVPALGSLPDASLETNRKNGRAA